MTQDLLLLPGLLCDTAVWQHQITSLQDIARITVVDLTCHDIIENMAEAILDRAPEKFALAGLSMGGYVAQEILRKEPKRVSRLALCDTNARSDTLDERKYRQKLIQQACVGNFHGITKQLLPLLIHTNHLENKALIGIIRAMAKRIGREVFIRQQTAISNRRDGRMALVHITCPTLVLCGKDDQITSWQVHAEMAAMIPQAQLVVIDAAAHLPPLEQPEAVSIVFRYWLEAN